MVQLALLVLAPLLGFTVADRRTIVGVLAGAWAALMIPQTHVVLLDEQLATNSFSDYGPLDDIHERYCTWAEAEAGHQAVVEQVKARGLVLTDEAASDGRQV